MQLPNLLPRPEIASLTKLNEKYIALQALVVELQTKTIPQPVAEKLQEAIENVNSASGNPKTFKKVLHQFQTKTTALLAKEVQLVTKDYYRNQWMAIGMAAIGLPVGVAFGLAINNLAMLSVGLPIGLGIGMAVGAKRDEKAKATGKQLNVHLKS